MDNAEILNEMGFTFITGDLWRNPQLGTISVSINDSLEKICVEIFKLGQIKKQEQVKEVLGL